MAKPKQTSVSPTQTQGYVDLGRSFHELTEEERADPNILAQLERHFMPGSLDWSDLLESERTVILAEAGSGKTRELREQKRRLLSEGKMAFFIPIEALHNETVEGILQMEVGEFERFEQWRNSPGEIAWFFLDAVDELKLSSGKLDIALGKVARSLSVARDRARIILSCRPTDWRPQQDLDTLQSRLPPSADQVEEPQSDDESFLQGIRERRAEPEAVVSAPKLRIVAMEGLNERQIRLFAAAQGVDDTETFVREIRRREAWSFARRPLDLSGLARIWNDDGKIGTRLEQHQADIDFSLKEQPDRPDAGSLSPDEARDGVERLALALLLTGNWTIKVPELACGDAPDKGMLDAEAVLTGWSAEKVQALLRRPIFDVATYGRVRFHHRSVMEYLSACRLNKLRAEGLPKRRLLNLLFAERYGEKVVIPSRRATTAWLALMDQDVLNFLLEREPETLVSHGDAEMLPKAARIRLIERYLEKYGPGGWRGLDLSITDLQRLANPDIGLQVRHLLEGNISNPEALQFLLKLVWLGPLGECADLAFAVAVNPASDSSARVYGMRALAETGRSDLLRQLADDMFANPSHWPADILHNAPDVLFPRAITTAELVQLIQMAPESQHTVGGFSWSLYHLVDELEPGSEGAVSLRRALADLVWDNRNEHAEWYQQASIYANVTPALAKLCAAELQRERPADPVLVRDAVIAHRFHGDQVIGREERQELQGFFSEDRPLRSVAFDIEVEMTSMLGPDTEVRQLLSHARYNSILGQLEASDWPWLFGALKASRAPRDRERFFRSLLNIGWKAEELHKTAELRAEVAGDDELRQILERWFQPPEPNPQMEELEREQEKHRQDRARRQENTERWWRDWRADIESDPAKAFSPESEENNRWYMVQWLMSRRDARSSRSGMSNWHQVRSMFGADVAAEFEASCRRYWRSEAPEVWSSKPEGERNRSTGRPYVALTALNIEAAGQGWAQRLSSEEAEAAAGWATTELNGYPEWFDALIEAHPDAVRRVLERELRLEMDVAATDRHLRTLNTLRYGSSQEAARLAAPYLRERLFGWPATADETSPLASHLDDVLTVLSVVTPNDPEVAALCRDRFLQNPRDVQASTWLRGLASNDFEGAFDAIPLGLKKIRRSERGNFGSQWLAGLFGERALRNAPIDSGTDAAKLKEFAKRAYEWVRREDDVHHDGVYTPGPRDDAESARNRILGALIQLPGQAAHDALLDLADEGLFAHMPDRLRKLATERAAIDSEPTALSVADFRQWESRFEAPPKNPRELFELVLDRLDDMAFDLVHHDFSSRAELAALADEEQLQRPIARYLFDHARQQYTTARESEAPDMKRRDVELAATGFVGKATVEIKVGDKWTVAQLEKAIGDQLVGRYLRHPENQVGILLVTFAGKTKQRFRVEDAGLLDFVAMIEHLRAFAAKEAEKRGGALLLDVVGLDLRSPFGGDKADTSHPLKSSGAGRKK